MKLGMLYQEFLDQLPQISDELALAILSQAAASKTVQTSTLINQMLLAKDLYDLNDASELAWNSQNIKKISNLGAFLKRALPLLQDRNTFWEALLSK